MRKRLGIVLGSLTIVLGILMVQGCGSDKKEAGAEPPIATASTTGNIQAKITSAVISATTGSLVVTFTLFDEKGSALDPMDPTINGKSFVVAQLGLDGNYHNPIRTSGGQPAADSGGTFAGSGGTYTYTFGKNITTLPGYDATKTYTVSAYIGRTIPNVVASPFRQISNPRIDFRPDGTAVTNHREVVAIDACNECHGKLTAHEGNRIDIPLCILCHNPGEIDPDTGNTIDFKGMIHKIHMGRNLPSNILGGAYGIIGFGNATVDFSRIKYPSMSADTQTDNKPVECIKCHRLGTDTNGNAYGRDADNWKINPTMEKCTTCHDTDVFDGVSTTVTVTIVTGPTPTTVAAFPHSGGQQLDNSACGLAFCHSSADDSAYATRSVPGMHTLPIKSSLNSGFTISITSVTNVGSGLTPSVTFTMKDAGNNTIDLSTATSGTNFVDIVLGYMTGPDYDNTAAAWIAGQSFVQGRRVRANDTAAHAPVRNADGSYTVSFGAPWSSPSITLPPAGVATFAAYGGMKIQISTTHRLTAGTTIVTLPSPSVSIASYDIATGLTATAAQQRRQVVSSSSCNMCHLQIAFHGRRTETQLCVICHGPNLYDITPPGFSGDLKDFLHGIHGTTPAISTSVLTTVFLGKERAGFPNDPRKCSICHINNSQLLPLQAGVRGSLKTGSTGTSLDGTLVLPIKAACVSCHDDALVSNHADSKVVSGVETCATCHGTGLLLGVDFVHLPAN